MEFLLILIAVLVVGAVVVPMLLRRNRDVGDEDVTHRGGIPGPGGPTPLRDGRPPRGSRPNRSAHGKP